MQQALSVLQTGREWLLAVGVFSGFVAGVALWRPAWARWPLQICAAVHLILVPWAAWTSHAALAEALPAFGTIGMLMEVVTVLATEAGLVVAMVATQRIYAERVRGRAPKTRA